MFAGDRDRQGDQASKAGEEAGGAGLRVLPPDEGIDVLGERTVPHQGSLRPSRSPSQSRATRQWPCHKPSQGIRSSAVSVDDSGMNSPPRSAIFSSQYQSWRRSPCQVNMSAPVSSHPRSRRLAPVIPPRSRIAPARPDAVRSTNRPLSAGASLERRREERIP